MVNLTHRSSIMSLCFLCWYLPVSNVVQHILVIWPACIVWYSALRLFKVLLIIFDLFICLASALKLAVFGFFSYLMLSALSLLNVPLIMVIIPRPQGSRICFDLCVSFCLSVYLAVQCLNCEKLAGGLNFLTVIARPKLWCKSYYLVYSWPPRT